MAEFGVEVSEALRSLSSDDAAGDGGERTGEMPGVHDRSVAEFMRQATTGEEMVQSWFAQRPGFEDTGPADGSAIAELLRLWIEEKPEMIRLSAHNQLTALVGEGVLDAKTRYLLILACYMSLKHWDGMFPQACNAKAAGATEEEIMEVAQIACYAVSKDKLVETGAALAAVFENPVFQQIEPATSV